jgi:xylulokinase
MIQSRAAILAIDIGTTHCKAGLLAEEAGAFRLARVASLPMVSAHAPQGHFYYDPEAVWAAVAGAIRQVCRGGPEASDAVAAIGIASMAETGLLVDRKTGAPRTPLIPWFDPSATPQAEALDRRIAREGDPALRFYRSGLRPGFKCSLVKLLWLREREPEIVAGAVWLSVADWVAYRLTGEMATDFSLAGRTYAFRIDRRAWDEDWLCSLGLEPGLFPPAGPSGLPVGRMRAAEALPLEPGIPVAIAGHDHVCGAFAAGAVSPGRVFDSMGTAEALTGALEWRELGQKEYTSGLMYGCHTARDRLYWMGGLSASGGSVEWLRSILGQPPLTYADLEALLQAGPPDDRLPTGILYFPYLSGSGSPHSDLRVRGAFVGLDASHGRSDLLKAVLEGAAYEMEFIRRAAEQATGARIDTIAASGGGTRLRRWMQIKADISGCRIEVLPFSEATLAGAALLAGWGCGVFASEAEAIGSLGDQEAEVFVPDAARHQAYRDLYEQGYLKLQQPLREVSIAGEKVIDFK